MTPTRPRQALSIAEAAAEYGLSKATIRRAIAAGDLVAKKPGRVFRIKTTDLEAWFDALPDA